jgi:hypothetical protein
MKKKILATLTKKLSKQNCYKEKSDFLVLFFRHKKELKSFPHSLTICDKVASGNNNKKKKEKNGSC